MVGEKQQTQQTVEEFVASSESKATMFQKLVLDISWMEHADLINSRRRGRMSIGKEFCVPQLDEGNRGAVKIARIIEQYNSCDNEFHKTVIFSVLNDYLGILEEDVIDNNNKVRIGFFTTWLKKTARHLKGQ